MLSNRPFDLTLYLEAPSVLNFVHCPANQKIHLIYLHIWKFIFSKIHINTCTLCEMTLGYVGFKPYVKHFFYKSYINSDIYFKFASSFARIIMINRKD